jgi:hypothetical protein
MNALKTGIDAQSQIITGEDPEAFERLTTQYYDRYEPQGPEEIALIDDAVSSDWLLRRLRKTEAQIWDRSSTEHAANLFKWGQKAEKYPLAAAFLDQQKAFERLQRRISAAERSLRAALETLARLRKVGQALSPGNPVAPAVSAAVPLPTLPQLLQKKPPSPKLASFLKSFLTPPRNPHGQLSRDPQGAVLLQATLKSRGLIADR